MINLIKPLRNRNPLKINGNYNIHFIAFFINSEVLLQKGWELTSMRRKWYTKEYAVKPAHKYSLHQTPLKKLPNIENNYEQKTLLWLFTNDFVLCWKQNHSFYYSLKVSIFISFQHFIIPPSPKIFVSKPNRYWIGRLRIYSLGMSFKLNKNVFSDHQKKDYLNHSDDSNSYIVHWWNTRSSNLISWWKGDGRTFNRILNWDVQHLKDARLSTKN